MTTSGSGAFSLLSGVIFYSSRRSGGSDHNGGRGKNEIPSGMVVVGLGVDEKSDGLRGELFDGLQNKERIGRVGAAIDQHDSFLGDDNAAIGSGISPLNVASAVDINSLSDFQEVRSQILCKQRLHQKQKPDTDGARYLPSHDTFLEHG